MIGNPKRHPPCVPLGVSAMRVVRLSDRARLVLWSLLIVVTILTIAVLTPLTILDKIEWKWVRFAAVTAIFVWYSLKMFRKGRAHKEFWIIVLSSLLVHLVGVGYFFWSGSGLSFSTFAPLVGAEWGIMAVILYKRLGLIPELQHEVK